MKSKQLRNFISLNIIIFATLAYNTLIMRTTHSKCREKDTEYKIKILRDFLEINIL